MLDAVLVALVLVPAVVGALLLLAGASADRFAAPVGAGVATFVAVASLPVSVAPGPRPAVGTPFMLGSELGLAVDGLAAVVLPVVAVVSALVLTAATGTPALRTARFHGLMLVFVAAAVMTVVATTLPALLMSWELMGATSLALIGYHWRERVTVGSGITAFLTTRAADLGLYVATGAALAGGTGLGLDALPTASDGWRDVAAAGLLVAGLGKAAQLPFSFWLSRAMDGPSPVSALLHSAAMVAMGGYLLLRVAPTLAATGWADDAAAWAGAATAVLLGLVALAQSDLKQLLAASTAAQLGFVVLAAGVGATAGGATHLVAHAAVKAGLFLAAGIWLEALGTKRLASLTGAARVWPLVGACSTAGLLSLAGLPPLALWATKDAVLAAAAEHSVPLYAAGLLGAALSAAYAGKALLVLTRPLPEDAQSSWDDEREGTRTAPTAARLTLLPLAAGALVLGTIAFPPWYTQVHELVGGRAPGAGGPGLVASGGVAVAVLVAAFVLTRGGRRRSFPWPRALTEWLHLERVAHATVVSPVEALARRLARVDDALLDRSVEATGRAAVRMSRLMARADDRGVDAGVTALVAGVRRAGSLVRRPQTGQLHQYYLQALTVLAVVLVVVVLVR